MIFSQISSIPSLFSLPLEKPFFFALKVYLHLVEKKEKEKGKKKWKTKEKEEEEEEKRLDKLVKWNNLLVFRKLRFYFWQFVSRSVFENRFNVLAKLTRTKSIVRDIFQYFLCHTIQKIPINRWKEFKIRYIYIVKITLSNWSIIRLSNLSIFPWTLFSLFYSFPRISSTRYLNFETGISPPTTARNV